jgi:glucose-6-phosphate isomerase
MLNIDFSHLNTISKNSSNKLGISNHELNSSTSKYNQFWSQIQSRGQGFIDLPYNAIVSKAVQDYVLSVKGKYDTVVILGIGGSMLGPKCILDALFDSDNSRLKFHCLDNIDPYKIAQIESQINLSKTLFLVQTKSGGTPETIAQYLYFRAKTDLQELEAKNHFVFVTDPQKGYLRQIANQENITAFDVPENVGGRFSVLTPIGLLATGLAGLNIDKLLLGAKDIITQNLNDAYLLGFSQYTLLQKGQNINVVMPYSSRLKTFSDWTVQLLSESLGKEFDLQGNLVNAGLTPLPAVGVTDQHSQLQLFAEGPNDKLIIFVKPENYDVTLTIPNTDESNLSYINNHTFNELIDAEFHGVKQSLTERNRANITINISKVDEYDLGALFMLFELATSFVGEMLDINTFDQPGVERSKVLSKENLLKL